MTRNEQRHLRGYPLETCYVRNSVKSFSADVAAAVAVVVVVVGLKQQQQQSSFV